MKNVWERMKEIVHKQASIICDGREFNTDEIMRSSYLLAREISKKREESKNANVAIYLEHDEKVLFSMIASLSLGLTYILIEPNLPDKRRDYILENSETDIVLTWCEKRNCFAGKRVIDVEQVLEEGQVLKMEYNLCAYENEISYICYTSGTTGKPKGVMVTYDGLVNFTKAMKKIVDFNSELSIACLTTSSFDIFFVESILPLIYGMKVHIASSKEASNPRKLIKFLLKSKVDIVQMTPSRLEMLLYDPRSEGAVKDIKTFLIGGEQFNVKVYNQLRSMNKTADIFNLYGPTETTIWSSYKKIIDSEDITIGTPLLGNEIIIYDNGIIRESGKQGEILISGIGLAKGYKNNDLLSKEKFVFIDKKRYFRTGDLGCMNETGDYCCMGRIDNQVKINGYRVELEEIECVVKNYEKIQNVIVYYEKQYGGLIALYTSEELIDEIQLVNYLRNKLPQYMIPTKYRRCESFFYSNNGKLSRKDNRIYLEEQSIPVE